MEKVTDEQYGKGSGNVYPRGDARRQAPRRYVLVTEIDRTKLDPSRDDYSVTGVGTTKSSSTPTRLPSLFWIA
jgi:hypothetical protein